MYVLVFIPLGVPRIIIVEQFDAQVPPPAFGLIEVCPVLIAPMSITKLDEKPDPALALDPLSTERRSSEVEGKLTIVRTTFHFVTTWLIDVHTSSLCRARTPLHSHLILFL